MASLNQSTINYLLFSTMSFLRRITNIIAPRVSETGQPAEEAPGIAPDMVSSDDILEALGKHFDETVGRMSTKYNLLYHTSFIIYIKASNYAEMSDGFPFLASGAERMLVERVKKEIARRHLTDYSPHSQYWEFQLVEIPDDAMLGNESMEGYEKDGLIQIASSVFPASDDSDSAPDEGRVVTTVHGVNSLKAIKNCIPREILLKLDVVEKDRVRLLLSIEDSHRESTTAVPATSPTQGRPVAAPQPSVKAAPSTTPAPQYIAVFKAEDGNFIDSTDKVRHMMAMTTDIVEICGRGGQACNPAVLRVDSDSIMVPHIRIRRNTANSRFQIMALGPAELNQRPLPSSSDKWTDLPNNSVIVLDDSIQIRFNPK